jgi:hypothetical protein
MSLQCWTIDRFDAHSISLRWKHKIFHPSSKKGRTVLWCTIFLPVMVVQSKSVASRMEIYFVDRDPKSVGGTGCRTSTRDPGLWQPWPECSATACSLLWSQQRRYHLSMGDVSGYMSFLPLLLPWKTMAWYWGKAISCKWPNFNEP